MAVKSIPIFGNTVCGALGTAGTISSDPIDLRAETLTGNMSFSFTRGGTGATCGSSSFLYSVAPVYEGPYTMAGTFGTHGATKGSDLFSLGLLTSMRIGAFMKIHCVSGTSAHVVMTGELNVW
jgi:hypothetical protein